MLVRNPSKYTVEGDSDLGSLKWRDIETAREANSLLIKTDSIHMLSSLHPSPVWITTKDNFILSELHYGIEDRLSALPIWLHFRTAGDGLVPLRSFESVKTSTTKSFELIQLAYKKLTNIPSIQFYEASKPTTNGVSHLYFRYLPSAFASSTNLLNLLNEQVFNEFSS